MTVVFAVTDKLAFLTIGMHHDSEVFGVIKCYGTIVGIGQFLTTWLAT